MVDGGHELQHASLIRAFLALNATRHASNDKVLNHTQDCCSYNWPHYSAKAAARATAATVNTDRDAMPVVPLLHVLVELAVISVTVVLPASTPTPH